MTTSVQAMPYEDDEDDVAPGLTDLGESISRTAGDGPNPGDKEPEDEEPELFDRIDALRVLRAANREEKGALLEEIGGPGKVEQDVVSELSKIRPLWQPALFPEAHRMAMRSLEVLDRNGARGTSISKVGPLAPVAQFVVQLLTRWIVKGYQNSLVTHIRKLYERREANCVWGSPSHVKLRRARINAVQVEQGLKGNPVGLPTFLLGGAFLTTILSGIQSAFRLAFGSTIGVIIGGALVTLIFLGLSWAALYSAAVARRRIRLTTDQPIKALYDVIGAAGDPPRDQSYNFAVLAIVLLLLAWLIIPIIVWRVVG